MTPETPRKRATPIVAAFIFAFGLAVLALDILYSRHIDALETRLATMEYTAAAFHPVCLTPSRHNTQE